MISVLIHSPADCELTAYLISTGISQIYIHANQYQLFTQTTEHITPLIFEIALSTNI